MAYLVNGELVSDELLFGEFHHLGGSSIDPSQPGAEHEARVLRQMAEQRILSAVLLRQLAVGAGITASDEEVDTRRRAQWGTSSASVCGPGVYLAIRDNLLIEKYSQWLTRHEMRPSREEVERYYEQHRVEFHQPERIEVAHIICNIDRPEDRAVAQSKMQQAEMELNTGKPFQKVAEKYSDCGGKVPLGWITRGVMVEEFDEVVFTLKRNERSEIFSSRFGLHIATVLNIKPAGYEPLQEVKLSIAKRMLEERRQKTVRLAVDEATRRAVIEVVA
ncbi:peptidylprolyl isomerase [Terriglobus saanensis]|uniref:peptidylprolyl isomerase n=1 Tax=Terriglobus saanensis (strain ATCC BAA-1853 / DSM 23119 / SP1PR4) TaxID=401053 RepID=E8UZ52_TERSS|nr:peptidylprolyl isomerase [Terriglobus saanensis]ADV82070.1 PpiC-type peptidyl-prolyl cis-trans isomerase [Terriglobus saanensis SP1PR4]